MSAIDNYANSTIFSNDEEAVAAESVGAEPLAPAKKKTAFFEKKNLPYLGGAAILTLAFAGFMYTKVISPGTQSAPYAMQFDVQPQSPTLEMTTQPAGWTAADVAASIPFDEPQPVIQAGGGALDQNVEQTALTTNETQSPSVEVEAQSTALETSTPFPQESTEAPVSADPATALEASAIGDPIAENGAASANQTEIEAAAQQTERIDTLEEDVGRINKQLEEIKAMIQELKRPAPVAAKLAPSSQKKSVKKREPAQKSVKKSPSDGESIYSVYGLKSDTAWLRNNQTGQNLSYRIGESVQGIGRIASIDMKTNSVKFENGAVLYVK